MNEEFIIAMRQVLQAAHYGNCLYLEESKRKLVAESIEKVKAFTDAAEQVHLEGKKP